MTNNRTEGSLRSTPTEDALTQMFDLQAASLSVPQKRPTAVHSGPEWISVAKTRRRSSRIAPALAVAAGAAGLIAIGVATRNPVLPTEAGPAQVQDVPTPTTQPQITPATSTATTNTSPASRTVGDDDQAGVVVKPAADDQPGVNVELDIISTYDIDTQTVNFEADSIRLTMNGETFDLVFELPEGAFETDPNLPDTDSYAYGAAVAPVSGTSNVGVWNRTTDLLLAGRHNNQTDRVFFDFESNGVEWWASTVWVSDQPGTPDNNPHIDGEQGWTALEGEFFRSPLGSKFVGDLQLAIIQITGLEIEAFREPPVCLRPRASVVLDFYDYPQHRRGLYLDYHPEWTEAEVPFSLIALDPYACMPVPLDRDTVIIVSSDDPTIVASSGGEFDAQDSIENAGWLTINLSAQGPGSTDITIQLEGPDGITLAEITVPVQVWDASGEYLD